MVVMIGEGGGNKSVSCEGVCCGCYDGEGKGVKVEVGKRDVCHLIYWQENF